MLQKLLSLFKSDTKKSSSQKPQTNKKPRPKKPKVEAARIGELGEHKINIQLDQLPKNCKYLSDIMLPNKKARSGYSQIDHVIISPYGLFVIETKNYAGEIKGGRSDKKWTVSNRYTMYNPLLQNYGHVKALERILGEFPSLLYISMVSFTMRCRFGIDPELRKIESNELVVYDVELSEYVARKCSRLKAAASGPVLAEAQIQRIYETVEAANITDPATRAAHVEGIKKS
ncbi:nuclease-related domain-containing protein [Paenibacillus sp. KR2-11]|uniref:nuclease-related domain-containing protein n=1 Tax=Paenibacillus sp. KR2-11 TaxID=3385500 RepID=UPI0038FCE282